MNFNSIADNINDVDRINEICNDFTNPANIVAFGYQFMNGNTFFVKTIIDMKLDVKNFIKTFDILFETEEVRSILQLVCNSGHIEILKMIIPFFDPEDVSKCLVYAVERNVCDIVDLVYPMASEFDKEIALVKSCKLKNIYLASFFLDKGIFSERAFFKAIKYNQIDIVKRMIYFGKYQNVFFYGGASPLHYACICESREVFDFLLDLCGPNVKDMNEETVLCMLISIRNKYDCFDYYIEKLVEISDYDVYDKNNRKLIDIVFDFPDQPFFKKFFEKIPHKIFNDFF